MSILDQFNLCLSHSLSLASRTVHTSLQDGAALLAPACSLANCPHKLFFLTLQYPPLPHRSPSHHPSTALPSVSSKRVEQQRAVVISHFHIRVFLFTTCQLLLQGIPSSPIASEMLLFIPSAVSRHWPFAFPVTFWLKS